jgi:hypothetical protein
MKTFIVSAILGLTSALAAQTSAVGIERVWARQPLAPLRIVRVVSTLKNPISEIAVKSASKGLILSYQLGWIPVVPAGCGNPLKASPRLLPKIQGPVWSGIGESVHEYEFDKTEVLEIAREREIRKIVLVLGVVEVELSNGWWRYDAGNDLLDSVVVEPFACSTNVAPR